MPIKLIKKLGTFVFSDGGTIKARVLRSGIWVGAGQVGVQLLSVVRSIALARLLTPDVFGFMALAMIAIRAIETFTRPGIAQALIARQAEFEDAGATAFTLLVARGVLLSLVLVAAAPFVAHFYEAPELETVLQVLSVTFVITGLSNINTIARQRELEFRRLTYIGQASNLVGTIVTVAIAWWLRSVWALVIGPDRTSQRQLLRCLTFSSAVACGLRSMPRSLATCSGTASSSPLRRSSRSSSRNSIPP